MDMDMDMDMDARGRRQPLVANSGVASASEYFLSFR